MPIEELLDQLRKAYPLGAGETHYEGCHLSHPRCAINLLIRELEASEKYIEELENQRG